MKNFGSAKGEKTQEGLTRAGQGSEKRIKEWHGEKKAPEKGVIKIPSVRKSNMSGSITRTVSDVDTYGHSTDDRGKDHQRNVRFHTLDKELSVRDEAVTGAGSNSSGTTHLKKNTSVRKA